MARSRSIGNVYAELSVKDKMTAGLSKAQKSVGKFASSVTAQLGAALGAGAIVDQLGRATMAASDFSETISKSNVVFGKSAPMMQAWADGMATAFGQSKTEALGAASTMGNMFLSMGMGSDQAAQMSRAMVELAGDLASFNNTSSADALEALGAGLRGEAEPLRRYGVLLDDATLKAKAFSMGIFNGTGSLTPATRALAAYQAILDQTKTAQGDFARTSDGMANSLRIIQAQAENAKIAIGDGMLPTVQKLSASMAEIDWQTTGEGLGNFVSDVMELGSAIGELINKYSPGMILMNKFFENVYGGPGSVDAGRAMEMVQQQRAADPEYMKPRKTAEAAKEAAKTITEAVEGIPEAIKATPFTTDIPEWLQRQPEAMPAETSTTSATNAFSSITADPFQANAYQRIGLALSGGSSLESSQGRLNSAVDGILRILERAQNSNEPLRI